MTLDVSWLFKDACTDYLQFRLQRFGVNEVV